MLSCPYKMGAAFFWRGWLRACFVGGGGMCKTRHFLLICGKTLSSQYVLKVEANKIRLWVKNRCPKWSLGKCNLDSHLRSPSGLILTHTHTGCVCSGGQLAGRLRWQKLSSHRAPGSKACCKACGGGGRVKLRISTGCPLPEHKV